MEVNSALATMYKGIQNPREAIRHFHEKTRDYRWKRIESGRTVMRKVFGFKMYLNENDNGVSKPLFLDGVFSPGETDIYSRIVCDDMVIADIGANIGYFSLQFAKNAPEGKIFAFEPEPTNYKLLERNLEANEIENVIPEQVAISSSEGETNLYEHPNNGGGHSLHKESVLPFSEFPNEGTLTKVNSITIDDYFSSAKAIPDFVKIDVEGSEPDVIMGMTDTLHREPILSFEYTPHMWSTDPERVFELLASHGYDFYEITPKGSLKPMTKDDLLEYEAGWYDIISSTNKKKLPHTSF